MDDLCPEGYARGSFSLDEIAAIKREIVRGAAYSDRISFGLACRLLNFETEYAETSYVLSEIKSLEEGEITATKAPQKFNYPPLNHFWHKHFTTPRHLFANVGLHWGIDAKRNKNHPVGDKRLAKLIENVADEHGSDPDAWHKSLSYRFIMEGLEARSGRMTGDWIIFAKHNDKNYYLDIASHEEADNPTKLIGKLRASSKAEFPFCFHDFE